MRLRADHGPCRPGLPLTGERNIQGRWVSHLDVGNGLESGSDGVGVADATLGLRIPVPGRARGENAHGRDPHPVSPRPVAVEVGGGDPSEPPRPRAALAGMEDSRPGRASGEAAVPGRRTALAAPCSGILIQGATRGRTGDDAPRGVRSSSSWMLSEEIRSLKMARFRHFGFSGRG